jgi:hypothetical protein
MVEEPPILTYEEMRKRFDGEWVLLIDYVIEPATNSLVKGRVVAHDHDVKKVEAVDRELGLTDAAYECFREPGDGTVLVL